MTWIKLKGELTPEKNRRLRSMSMLAASIAVVGIFFAWAVHDINLNQHTRRGKYLEGVVDGKDARAEGGGDGVYLVRVAYQYDGEKQVVLTSDFITEAQWEKLAVGDSVSLLYHPRSMMANDSGKVYFQDEPVLELAFQPALNKLRWYPMIATLVFLLGLMPSILHSFRRRRASRS